MKYLLMLLCLTGCGQQYYNCTTTNPGEDFTKVYVSNGGSYGRYYCKEVFKDHAKDCIEIYTRGARVGEYCNANDIQYSKVVFGSSIVEIQ